MRGEMTPAVQRAVEAARSWAVAAARPTVAPDDLLAGLLLEEEGRAALMLIEAGLDVVAYVISLNLTAPQPDPLEVPLDRDANEVWMAARGLALEIDGERTVSGPALLLALLRGTEPLRQTLESRGLDFAAMEATLERRKLPPIQLEEPLLLAPVGEEIDLARILDAAGNRAREALRVIEDYCRFTLDDATLTRLGKELRHDLQQTLSGLSVAELLHGRDTPGDVGTGISVATEQRRESIADVVRAGCKRLQEALRSLEEFAKVRHSETAAKLEQLRYRSYTLERAIFTGSAARERLEGARLYALITGAACALPMRETIFELASGGVDLIQLREKTLSDRELLARARQVRQWTREAGILFLMNDRADLARLVEADGVHLGRDDLPVREARRLLGTEAILGVSTHRIEQVRQAVLDGATYLGIGPTFPSKTKQFDELAGLEFVQAALAETTLPAFAIGGINLATLPRLVAIGANRIAVSQALTGTDTPAAVARAMRQQLRG